MSNNISNIIFNNIISITPSFDINNNDLYKIKRENNKLSISIIINNIDNISIHATINNFEPVTIKPSLYESNLVENFIELPSDKCGLKISIVSNSQNSNLHYPDYFFDINEIGEDRSNPNPAPVPNPNIAPAAPNSNQANGAGTLCTHEETTIVEGEIWGGCSGSCQIEYFQYCVKCRKELRTWIEYHN